MKAKLAALALALLAGVSGCAKSDWIERTLVTVDVTGTWSGRVAARGGAISGPTGTLWFDLEQKGATVNGHLKYLGAVGPELPPDSTPIEGTVTGDVFRFKLGTAGRIGEGELTVTGDEMAGQVWLQGGLRPISLQRTDPSTRPPR